MEANRLHFNFMMTLRVVHAGTDLQWQRHQKTFILKKVERSYSEIHWSKKCDSSLTYKYIHGVLKFSCLQLFTVMFNLNKQKKILPQQWFFQIEANVSS